MTIPVGQSPLKRLRRSPTGVLVLHNGGVDTTVSRLLSVWKPVIRDMFLQKALTFQELFSVALFFSFQNKAEAKSAENLRCLEWHLYKN